MKKRAFVVVACLCLALAAVGCSKKDTTNNDSTSESNVSGETGTVTGTATGTGTVTIGEYKGIEVTVTPIEVTDEEIQSSLDNFVSSHTSVETITDRTDVQSGDVANIDFVGKVDGKEFDGGSAQGTDLTIGSGSFIPGFEDQLIGKTVGETADITVTFPEDYSSADLAGKEAVFTVTINSIGKNVTPELTDALVADNTDYKTVDSYRTYLADNLKTNKEAQAKQQKELDVIDAIIAGATFNNVPQDEYDQTEARMRSYYESMATSYGLDFETFILYYFGMNADQYETEVKNAAEQAVKQQYVLEKVVELENLTLTDDEYKAGVDELVANYGYESAEAFEEANSKETIEKSLLVDKAVQFVVDNAVEVAAE